MKKWEEWMGEQKEKFKYVVERMDPSFLVRNIIGFVLKHISVLPATGCFNRVWEGGFSTSLQRGRKRALNQSLVNNDSNNKEYCSANRTNRKAVLHTQFIGYLLFQALTSQSYPVSRQFS
jgi:hypothetical protein